MQKLEEYDIRYTDIKYDLPYLEKWLLDKRCEKWFPMEGKQEIENGAKNWVGFAKYRASITATIRKKPVGMATLFLMPYKKLIHHAQFYLIVAPDYEHMGIGSSLLKNIQHLATHYYHFESIHCEIFSGSKMVSLLEKAGFVLFCHQPKYIKLDDGSYLDRLLYGITFQQLGDR